MIRFNESKKYIMKDQFIQIQIQLDQMTDEEIFDKQLKEEGKI
jgi:hypothetical protein